MSSKKKSRVTFGTFSKADCKWDGQQMDIHFNGDCVGYIEKEVTCIYAGLTSSEDRAGVCSYSVVFFDCQEEETFRLSYNRRGELRSSSMTWREALSAAKDHARDAAWRHA